MKRIILAVLAAASLATAACAVNKVPSDTLAAGFARPPQSARPWVYWFPLSGNLSKEGITADLEASSGSASAACCIWKWTRARPRARPISPARCGENCSSTPARRRTGWEWKST